MARPAPPARGSLSPAGVSHPAPPAPCVSRASDWPPGFTPRLAGVERQPYPTGCSAPSVTPAAGGGAPLPPSSSSQPLASHRAPRPCGARPCSRVEPPPPPPPQLEASAPGPSAPCHVGLQHRRPPARPAASRRRRRRSRGCGGRPSAGPTGRGRPGRRRPRRRRPGWRRRVRGPLSASRGRRPGDPQGRLRRRRAAGPPDCSQNRR